MQLPVLPVLLVLPVVPVLPVLPVVPAPQPGENTGIDPAELQDPAELSASLDIGLDDLLASARGDAGPRPGTHG